MRESPLHSSTVKTTFVQFYLPKKYLNNPSLEWDSFLASSTTMCALSSSRIPNVYGFCFFHGQCITFPIQVIPPERDSQEMLSCYVTRDYTGYEHSDLEMSAKENLNSSSSADDGTLANTEMCSEPRWEGEFAVTPDLTHDQATECCSSYGARVFIPTSKEESEFLAKKVTVDDSFGRYPANDKEAEGIIVWDDGTLMSEGSFTPEWNKYIGKNSDRYDCLSVDSRGVVYWYSCSNNRRMLCIKN